MLAETKKEGTRQGSSTFSRRLSTSWSRQGLIIGELDWSRISGKREVEDDKNRKWQQ